MKNIVAIILFSFVSTALQGQFINSGTIEYTRTTNNHMALKIEFANNEDMRKSNFSLEDILKFVPKYSSRTYLMTFDEEKSFYRFDKEGEGKMNFGMEDPASKNIVIKNFKTHQYQAEKDVMNTIFLIQEEMPQYTWKIHDEVREIAGYPCRKATTVILDSVYVVAFYTENITVSGGPESFNGLPGMILGLAVPRLYTTWFATKVELKGYDPSIEKPFNTKKSKITTTAEMRADIEKNLKDWGEYGTQVLYKISL